MAGQFQHVGDRAVFLTSGKKSRTKRLSTRKSRLRTFALQALAYFMTLVVRSKRHSAPYVSEGIRRMSSLPRQRIAGDNLSGDLQLDWVQAEAITENAPGHAQRLLTSKPIELSLMRMRHQPENLILGIPAGGESCQTADANTPRQSAGHQSSYDFWCNEV